MKIGLRMQSNQCLEIQGRKIFNFILPFLMALTTAQIIFIRLDLYLYKDEPGLLKYGSMSQVVGIVRFCRKWGFAARIIQKSPSG